MLFYDSCSAREFFTSRLHCDLEWDEEFARLFESVEDLESLFENLCAAEVFHQQVSKNKPKQTKPSRKSSDSLKLTKMLKTFASIPEILARETFDPHEMLKHLKNTYNGPGAVNDENTYQQDISDMVSIFVSIGNDLDFMKKKGSSQLKNTLEVFFKVYGLSQDRGRKVTLNPKRITLLRVSASYPAYTIKLFIEFFDEESIDVEYGIPGCRKEVVLHAPFLAAVLPRDARDSLHHFLLLKALTDNKLLQKYTDPKILIENYRSVFNWTALNKVDRLAFSEYLGLFRNGVLEQKYRKIDEAALKILSRYRSWKNFLPFKN